MQKHSRFLLLKEMGDERQRLKKKEDGDGIGRGLDDGSMYRHSGFGEKQNAEETVFEDNDNGGGHRREDKGVREEDKAVQSQPKRSLEKQQQEDCRGEQQRRGHRKEEGNRADYRNI